MGFASAPISPNSTGPAAANREVEGQWILHAEDIVEYKSSQAGWITAKVILAEPGRIQIDVKKGQWLTNADIQGRLRTKDKFQKPCVIGSCAEDSRKVSDYLPDVECLKRETSNLRQIATRILEIPGLSLP